MAIQVYTPGVKPISWLVSKDRIAPEFQDVYRPNGGHQFPLFKGGVLDVSGKPIVSAVHDGWTSKGALRFTNGSTHGIIQAIGSEFGTTPNITLIIDVTLRSGSDPDAYLFCWAAADNNPRFALSWNLANSRWQTRSNSQDNAADNTAVQDVRYQIVCSINAGGDRRLWVDGELLINTTVGVAGVASTNYAWGRGVNGTDFSLAADFHSAIVIPTAVPDSVGQRWSMRDRFGPFRPARRRAYRAPAVAAAGNPWYQYAQERIA